jgi:FKBP-type peptidyl-prolyl cis-trans isomerase FkpA
MQARVGNGRREDRAGALGTPGKPDDDLPVIDELRRQRKKGRATLRYNHASRRSRVRAAGRPPGRSRPTRPALPDLAMIRPTLHALALFAFAAVLLPAAYAQNPSTPGSKEVSKMDAIVGALKKIDTKQGTGAEAVAGKAVVVHYTGWLYDPSAPEGKGKKFDSSLDRREPFSFPLGGGRVIRGWDEGVAGMKVGGKRTLIIPADLGYGARGAGGVIPPNAALVFDVELLEVR